MTPSSTQARARAGYAPAARRQPPLRKPPKGAVRRRRRRVFGTLIAIAALTGLVLALIGPVQKGIKEIVLPLQHEDIIRQQAREKSLDPALIAAVIYQESKFEDRTSSAGATGLMQLLPDTAKFIAHKTGGSAFQLRDLATPQINIAYGSWYLRYLIDRYGGNETLAVAAYNAGEQNVDKWVRDVGGAANFDPQRDIPFGETRAYVASVSSHRRQYRRRYSHELGLDH